MVQQGASEVQVTRASLSHEGRVAGLLRVQALQLHCRLREALSPLMMEE